MMNQQAQTAEVSKNIRFASAVAEFGLLLRGSEYKGSASYSQILRRARQAKGPDLGLPRRIHPPRRKGPVARRPRRIDDPPPHRFPRFAQVSGLYTNASVLKTFPMV